MKTAGAVAMNGIASEEWPPRVPAADVAGINALFARRGPIAFQFRGEPARLVLGSAAAPPEGPAFRIAIGGAQMVARVSETLAAELLRPLRLQKPLAGLEPEPAALLMEFAFADEIERLEGIAGEPAAIETRIDGPIGPGAQRFALELRLGDDVHQIALWLGRQALASVGAALDRAAAPLDDPMAGLAMPVRVCMGWRELRLSDLKDLARGDVVLVESGKEMAGPIAVVAGRLATRLAVSSGRLVASSSLTALRGSFWEWCMEGESPNNGERAIADAEIDALPVKLIFELGRTEMPLADVRRLEAGSVVPLARALDEAVDIVANGKRIGRGSIVRIGDAVGVRVERLTANE